MFNVYRAVVALELQDERQRPAIERRVIRNSVDPFSIDDNAFLKNFRLTKAAALDLIDQLKDLLDPALGPKTFIPAHLKVLCALFFYGSGSYQSIIGNSMFSCMGQTSVSKSIRTVTVAIIRLAAIRFPTTNAQRNSIKEQFKVLGLPGIIGCVDATHVAIATPYEREDAYVNTKGYHSINVQITCDNNFRILNIIAKFPGDTEDDYIWWSCKLKELMKENHASGDVDSALLGDSSYPLEPWLLTPFSNPAPGSLEEKYNYRHARAHNCVQRCIGLMKGRWRCLQKDRRLRYQPSRAASIVMACATLHNLALDHRVPNPPLHYDETDLEPPIPIDEEEPSLQGLQFRDEYIKRL